VPPDEEQVERQPVSDPAPQHLEATEDTEAEHPLLAALRQKHEKYRNLVELAHPEEPT
jgi:hypothetical protein